MNKIITNVRYQISAEQAQLIAHLKYMNYVEAVGNPVFPLAEFVDRTAKYLRTIGATEEDLSRIEEWTE